MKTTVLALLLVAGSASAADLVPLKLATGETLAVQTFNADADYGCFVIEGATDKVCTSVKTAVAADGSFSFGGKVYKVAKLPAGVSNLAVKPITLPDGTGARGIAGNAAGESALSADRYIFKAAPPPVKLPGVPSILVPMEVSGPAPDPNTLPPGPVGSMTCAGIAKANPGVLFCEDFENLPNLSAWTARYGAPFDGCINGNCVSSVVDGGFLGTHSHSMAFQPGREGGTTGLIRFSQTAQRRVTITMARKYSSNFVPRDHGVKDHRFEEDGGNVEIFGESSTGPGKGKGTQTSGNRFPWGAPLDIEPNSCIQLPFSSNPQVCTTNATATVGYIGENDVHFDMIPGGDYDFAKDMKPGSWVCLQAAFDNWGTAQMHARYWVSGKKVIDVANFDGTKLRGALKNGVTTYDFVAFYNDGYAGSDVAQRLDDNIVISTGAEPIPCSAIGF